MARTYHLIEKYRVEVETTAPLHIGSGTREDGEVLLHPVTEIPFIQSSSIAGVFRSISEILNGKKETEDLFGAPNQTGDTIDNGSRVIISDGEMDISTVKMEYRPRVAIDSYSGAVSSSKVAGSGNEVGHHYGIELIGTGAKIIFFLYLFHQKEDQLKNNLERILASLKTGYAQIGGQKTNGSGFLKLTSLKHYKFDMKQENDRIAWAEESSMDDDHVKSGPRLDYTEISDDLSISSSAGTVYAFKITGKTEGALLVKGLAVDGVGKEAPDAENMKNAAGEYIVPGSSLKGALKSRMTYIAEYIDKQEIIKSVFGRKGSAGDPGTSGNLIFKDIVITEHVGTVVQHRIHIDKFTGGVKHGELFSEKAVSGDITAEITVEDCSCPHAAAGLLILALRDLAVGMINLGSGYNIGRGFITVDKVTISATDGRQDAVITFPEPEKHQSGRINDPNGLIGECLSELDKWRKDS